MGAMDTGFHGCLQNRLLNKLPAPPRIRNQSNPVITSPSLPPYEMRQYVTLTISSCQITLQLDRASGISITLHNVNYYWKTPIRIHGNANGQQIPFDGEPECEFPFHSHHGHDICYMPPSDYLIVIGCINKLEL